MENYIFLAWLNNFLNVKNDKRSNLKNDKDNADSNRNKGDKKDEITAISNDDTGRILDAKSNTLQRYVKWKMNQSMTSPKESSSRNQSGSNMVSDCSSGKGKKQKKLPPKRTIQQKFSKKVKNGEDEAFGDMVASELKGLSCFFLQVKFKHEVNNLIFKNQMLVIQQNAPPNTPIHFPPSTFKLKSPTSQSNCAVFMQNTNGRSLDCYDSSKSSNKWNTLDLYILILTALYSCSLWNVIKLIFKFELFPLTFPTLLPNRAATVLMQFQVATIFLWQHFGVFINFRRPSPLVCDLNSSSLILPSANSTLTKPWVIEKDFSFWWRLLCVNTSKSLHKSLLLEFRMHLQWLLLFLNDYNYRLFPIVAEAFLDTNVEPKVWVEKFDLAFESTENLVLENLVWKVLANLGYCFQKRCLFPVAQELHSHY